MAREKFSHLNHKLLEELVEETDQLYQKGMSVDLASRRIVDAHKLPDLWRRAISSKLRKKRRSRASPKKLSHREIADLVEGKLKEGVPFFRAVIEVVKEKEDKISEPPNRLFGPIGKILRGSRQDAQIRFFSD